jgi:hypothetical protein
MKNTQLEDNPTPTASDLRRQLKDCEERAKIIREALKLSERMARLTRLLNHKAPVEGRIKDEKVVTLKPPVAGRLRDEIRAMRAISPRISATQVLERLANFPFRTDPKKAIGDALYQLRQQGELKIAVKGKGGKPGILEWQQSAKPFIAAAN